MWQEQPPSNSYTPSSSQPSYYSQQAEPLQFYSQNDLYGSRAGLQGSVDAQGSMASTPGAQGFIQQQGPWWTAFGTGGFEGEPPLLEELGINFAHIRAKSLAVLNPLGRIDANIMDDADLAGPVLFCFCFATCLLFSGKPQFGYIYGLALLGSISIYTLLNFMSPKGIDAYRTASVLGYCLLPMVAVGALSVVLQLHGMLGYILSSLSIAWCTWAASGIFVAVLQMSDQRFLVAYPVGLLYGCFALLSIFNVGSAAAK